MIRPWHILVFGLVLTVAALALAPARMFLHPVKDGLTFTEASGTIWDARLTRASIGGLDAGDLGIRVSPLDLLLGRIVADIGLEGADIAGQARVQLGLGGERRITAPDLRIAGLPLASDIKLPGQTTLRNLDLTLDDQACRAAQGVLESDTLERSADLLGGNGPTLSGVASCNGPVGRLMLTGERDGDSALVILDLSGNGAAQWSMTYRTDKPEVAGRLAMLGLAPQSETGSFAKRGATRWLPF
jgi:hypothetical protein